MNETKVCSKCSTEKPLSSYRARKSGQLRNECSDCLNAALRLWQAKNKEKCRAYSSRSDIRAKTNARARKRYATDPAYKAVIRAHNKEFIRTKSYKTKRNEYIKRWAAIPKNRIARSLRSRLHHALKGVGKKVKSETLLGCSYEDCRQHIESQFAATMTWGNHGAWHIDHIIPCDHFDLTDDYQQRLCFNYRNLRPIWANENLSKGRLLPELYCETLAALKSCIARGL